MLLQSSLKRQSALIMMWLLVSSSSTVTGIQGSFCHYVDTITLFNFLFLFFLIVLTILATLQASSQFLQVLVGRVELRLKRVLLRPYANSQASLAEDLGTSP
jgi:hypothetical protein